MRCGIDGKTAIYGLIGNPVAHSLSPAIHNALAQITGVNSVYVAFPVTEPSTLGKALTGAYSLGVRGLNVTIPYKKSVLPMLCDIDETALRIGAVNTVKHTDNGYAGYNTDYIGVIRTLGKHGVCLENRSLIILGAGGAAYACAFAAAEYGAKQIYIANRTNNNSELLASRIKKYYNEIEVKVISYSEIPAVQSGYFIMQTSSVGMGGWESPIVNLECIRNSSGVFDVIYTPKKTKILSDAEREGKPFINGIDMLIYQAVRAFEIWNGIEVDNETVGKLLEHIDEILKLED